MSQQVFAIGSGQAAWTFSKVHKACPACWCKKAECGRTCPACRGKNGYYSSRARFALYHTYSFLPVHSVSKTCQEQVSPCLSKMNLCPPAPCWGLRTPIPRGSISSHSFAEKSAKVIFENDYGTDENSAPSFFCFSNLQVSRIFDRIACGWSCLYWKRKITLVKC